MMCTFGTKRRRSVWIRSSLSALALALAITTPASAGIYVIDGDTIIVDGEHIRVLDIDAPETRQAQCDAKLRRGLDAKARVIALLQEACGPLAKADARRCIVIDRQHQRDRYGRTLARIGASGRDLAATLIAEGMARPYICPRGRCPARKPWCGVPAP